jgi:DNA invertase Pin-like site-specific DNA recombinase
VAPTASTREQRPGFAALLDYAREGDAIVVVGIDRLGRNAAEVMTTIRELGERGIVLRSLREGIDTSNATGRVVAGVFASLAELELELGRERRAASRDARRARGQSVGRPKALDKAKVALAQRMQRAVSRRPPSPQLWVLAAPPCIGRWAASTLWRRRRHAAPGARTQES